jgi:hypothetical protein
MNREQFPGDTWIIGNMIKKLDTLSRRSRSREWQHECAFRASTVYRVVYAVAIWIKLSNKQKTGRNEFYIVGSEPEIHFSEGNVIVVFQDDYILQRIDIRSL